MQRPLKGEVFHAIKSGWDYTPCTPSCTPGTDGPASRQCVCPLLLGAALIIFMERLGPEYKGQSTS